MARLTVNLGRGPVRPLSFQSAFIAVVRLTLGASCLVRYDWFQSAFIAVARLTKAGYLSYRNGIVSIRFDREGLPHWSHYWEPIPKVSIRFHRGGPSHSHRWIWFAAA